MAQYHQVLWSEGLFLTQHHFQQRDHYFDKDVSFRVRSAVPFCHGVSQMVIDTDAVANKMFTLHELEGVLPDGTTVRIPRVDEPPPSRSLEEAFAPTEATLSVYLGLPILRSGLPGVRMGGGGKAVQTRYSREFATLPDMVTGEGEREIAYTKRELCLLFSGEDLNDYDYLKIAEVVRNVEGVMVLNEKFVPPAMAIGASVHLKNRLKALLEVCSAKSDALAERVRQRTPQMAEFTGSDMPNFLLLHTINAAIPALAHFYNHAQSHPLDVFRTMARLAGALCTFSVGSHPRDLPVYNHEDIGGSFDLLETRLRDLLEMVVQARYVKIPLTQKEPTHFAGTIPDPQVTESGQFYLGVKADIPESKLITEFPLQGKVISPDKIAVLIEKNLPGVGLVYVAHPPAALPVKAGLAYFRLENVGDRWDFICRANAVSVYAPPGLFPGLSVELMAILG